MFNLGRPMNRDRKAQMGISTVERLRFKSSTSQVPYLMHKLLKFICTCNIFQTIKHRENELSPTN